MTTQIADIYCISSTSALQISDRGKLRVLACARYALRTDKEWIRVCSQQLCLRQGGLDATALICSSLAAFP